MADGLYDHSGNSPRIQNPMRFFGAMKIVRGGVIAGLAAMTLFLVKENLKIDPTLGYITTAIGFLLMGLGIRDIATGFQALFRLFVGRTLPVSLALNKEETDKANASVERKFLKYTSDELKEQLKKRVNTSFTEPTGWMANLLATFYPNFIIQPQPIRGVMLGVFSAVSKTVIAMIVMATVWFASATGLAGEAGELVQNVTLLALTLYIAFVWSRIGYDDTISSNGQIARALSFAILAPVLTGYGYQEFIQSNSYYDAEIGEILNIAYHDNFSNGVLFAIILVFAVIAAITSIALLVTRPKMNTRVKVAEFTQNIQDNFRPQDLFNNMEAMVWRKYREDEIPNRVYQKHEYIGRSSEQNSEVHYEQLLESQPTYKKVEASITNRVVRALSAVFFAGLGVAGVASLYFGVEHLSAVFADISWTKSDEPEIFLNGAAKTIFGTASYVIYAWVFMCMSKSAAKILMPFISEVHWESRVMHFEMKGTANESRHVAGNAILDSHSTENVISRCSLTPWLWAAKIQTTSFVNLYGKGLRSPRVIMNFEEDHDSNEAVFNDINEFISSRVNITTVAQSKNDLESTLAMNTLNNHAKAGTAGQADVAALLAATTKDGGAVAAAMLGNAQEQKQDEAKAISAETEVVSDTQ